MKVTRLDPYPGVWLRRRGEFIGIKRARGCIYGIKSNAPDAAIIQRDLVQAIRNINVSNAMESSRQPSADNLQTSDRCKSAQRGFISHGALKAANRHKINGSKSTMQS